MDILLLAYSVLPIFLIGLYIYVKDKNKESTNLLIKLLLGGFLSAIITVMITVFIGNFIDIFNADYTKLTGIKLIIYAFICVALIEELSKWIMLYKIAYNNEENDETYDMLLYGSYIGLGFACIENIIYVSLYGVSTAIIRAFTAVPMHTTLGIIMGYYLGKTKVNSQKTIKNAAISIGFPIFMHGAYDYYLMQGETYFISIVILIIGVIYAIILIKKTSKKSIQKNNISTIYMTFQENYCTNCGTKYDYKFCGTCGKKRI